MDTVVCKICGGSGRREHGEFGRYQNFIFHGYENCFSCKGRGQIPIDEDGRRLKWPEKAMTENDRKIEQVVLDMEKRERPKPTLVDKSWGY